MYSSPKGRGRCAGPSIFLVLGKKDTGEKEPLSKSKGFLGTISAHYRSRPLALALREKSSDTLDEAKRKTEHPVNYPVIPNRCAHR